MDTDAVNDIVLSGLDQTLPMQKAQVELLERVDAIIDRAVERKNPDVAAGAMVSLAGISRMSGLASAKFIYIFKYAWKNFPQSKVQSFEDYANDKLGYHKSTVKRYYNVWDMLVSHDIPKEYSDKLKLQPIRCLISIATMWTQGVQVESNQWMKLANAPDPATVNKIIREIKKVEPKKGSIQIEMSEDGTLYAWQNDKRYFIGSLNVEDTQEVVQKAIARLVGDGRVTEK